MPLPLMQVLNESVRLSVSSYLMRQAQTDVVIEGGLQLRPFRAVEVRF